MSKCEETFLNAGRPVLQYKCTVASQGIEGKSKFTQRICNHVILSNLIAQIDSKRNDQMKELVKLIQQVKMIKLVTMRLRSVLRSWEN